MSILSVPDGYDSNPMVRRAVTALAAFGPDLNHADAARLLRGWARKDELTDRERVAVLARFPQECEQ